MAIGPEHAETVALSALGWIAGNEELLPVFLGATGTDLADVRRRAAEPEFLAAVLDFLLMDDAWVVAFCGAAGLPCEMPRAARFALPGSAAADWA